MKISTLSVVCGTEACNAKCPFCVSKMTPSADPQRDFGLYSIHRNLDKTIQYALQSGVSTVLLTGKGEPTLFPKQITMYLDYIKNRFPFLELQTNGILLENDALCNDLGLWYMYGLTTVSLSVVSEDPLVNRVVAGLSDKIDLVVEKLHQHKLSVRINCTLLKGFVDDVNDVMKLIKWCKRLRVEQLTIRPVAAPEKTESPEVLEWVKDHEIPVETHAEIYAALRRRGTVLLELPHNATIFDVDGQNVCMNNCLTLPKGDEIRQLIFFPDGHLRYDWVYPGAILI